MDLGSIFLLLALLTLVAMFVGRPIFERKRMISTVVAIDESEHQRSALLAERDRILNAIQELDFDNALGKIPEDDYPGQRQRLLANGAAVLRQLDALETGAPSDAASAEDLLETAIAARRVEQIEQTAVDHSADDHAERAASADAEDDELEAMLARRRRARQEKAAGFCHKCGGPVRKSDKFCPKCGAKIS